MDYVEIVLLTDKILYVLITVLLIFFPIAYKLSLKNKVELEKKKEVYF